MSAWSTNGRMNAILADAIVAAGLAFGRDPETAAATFDLLAEENELSMAYRYGDNHACETKEAQEARRYNYVPGGEVAPLTVYTLAHSYDYQSCEHPGWPDSLAHHLIRDLIRKLEEQHGWKFDAVSSSTPGFAWDVPDDADTDRWYKTHASMHPVRDAEIAATLAATVWS